MTEQIDESQLIDFLENLAGEVAEFDYSKELTEFLSDFVEQHSLVFSGQNDSIESSWDHLAASTVNRRVGGRILFESGAREASLVLISDPENIRESSPQGFIFETNAEYTTFHQTGTFKKSPLPSLGLSDETVDAFVNKAADAAVEKLKH